MARSKDPGSKGPGSLQFLWFFPTNGDVRFFGPASGLRKVDNGYLRELALGLDRLGYFGALLPTGNFCEDALVVASSLVTHTERLRYLLALRPGSIVPAEFGSPVGSVRPPEQRASSSQCRYRWCFRRHGVRWQLLAARRTLFAVRASS